MRSRLAALVLAIAGSAAMADTLPYGDPTQPTGRRVAAPGAADGASEAPPPPRWALSSTLVAGERRVAVINGRSVALGATIAGARVVAIDRRGAWIEHQGRRTRLELPRPASDRITAKTPTGR